MGVPSRHSLYSPFRALGYVTNDVPLSLQVRGGTFFITTCIGQSFQTYNLEKMNLLFVGANAPADIDFVLAHDDFVFAACNNEILKYHRGRLVEKLGMKRQNALKKNFRVIQMMILGDLLLTICDDNYLRIWNHARSEFSNEIGFPASFQVTCMLHPNTYINKILIASSEGHMQLWNISTMKLVYDFPNKFLCPITFLCQSPVIDVVAIGLLDGRIYLHNLKVDKKIAAYEQEGKVTGISFRTDNVHMMASSNNQGEVVLWDLENTEVFHKMKNAHDGNISSLHFLHGQPILLTAGNDNSVKQWIFDTIDGTPRLLKQRSGHHEPPTQVQFYSNDGHHLLSIGHDKSVRFFSLIRDSQNVELSQGSLAKKSKSMGVKMDDIKLTQSIALHSNAATRYQWDSVITAHSRSSQARTWNFENKCIGKHALSTADNGQVTMVAISYCGNFGFVGSSLGSIAMYNMQSGLSRQNFVGPQAHNKSITGLATDNLSKTLISSSLDGTIKFWSIKSGELLETIELEAAAVNMVMHSDSGLIALGCDDACVRVIDIFTKKIVREFWGHRNRITGLDFSPDGRWLVSCALDATIRTWDLPSCDCIDIFKTETVPTSVAFSPVGDFLATTHVNHLGIFLWANRAQYQAISFRRVDDSSLVAASLPTALGQETHQSDESNQNEMDVDEDSPQEKWKNTEDLDDDLIALSSMPSSRWEILLNLDMIKRRNKPKQPPKAPEKAPFFLPMTDGLQPQFDLSAKGEATKNEKDEMKKMENSNAFDATAESEFTRLLRSTEEFDSVWTAWFAHLKSLSPSAADLEIRMMDIEFDVKDAKLFVHALEKQAETGKDMELVNVYLNVFLKIHGDVLLRHAQNQPEFREALVRLNEMIERKWKSIGSKMQKSLALLEFIRFRR